MVLVFLQRLLAVSLLLLTVTSFAFAESVSNEITKLLPKELGSFRQVSIRSSDKLAQEGGGVEAEYASSDGKRLTVELVRFSQDSDAYSLLTVARKQDQALAVVSNEVGTATVVSPGSVSFFKGRTFVRVSEPGGSTKEVTKPLELARLISDRLENGEGEIPVLVKHLPQWEEAQKRVIYLARFKSLKDIIPGQPILEAVKSEGDADAVATNYDGAHLLIVEFNTPQLAADNDRDIIARIQELRTQGQPVPSSYRRVGNYSVFVFNAQNEQAGNALIDQVKYEQLVHWLGENPNAIERAQRDYYLTTAGVLVAVIKASGLSLLACFAIGGLLGAWLFNRRRAQQRTAEAFSDAGGMLRLNIDDMTPKSDPSRLLGPGH
jgi:uncharacterized protein DUF6599